MWEEEGSREASFFCSIVIANGVKQSHTQQGYCNL